MSTHEPRHEGEAERGREAELTSRLALIAGAVVVYGLYLGSFTAAALQDSISTVVVLAAIAVVLMPFGVLTAQHLLRARFDGLSPRGVASLALVQLLPFLFLPPRVELLVPALLVLLQGNLLLRSKHTQLAIASAALGPLFVLIQMALAPAPIWLFGFAISVALTLVTALFLGARENRRWILRRARPGIARVDVGRLGAIRTTVYGLVVAILLLLVVPFLYLPLLLLPEPVLNAASAPEDSPEIEPTADTGLPGVGQDARETFQQIFPGRVNFGGGVSPLEAELVMKVTPVPERPGDPPVDRGPLYMRGMVLDTLLEHGVATSGTTEPVEITDGADGRSDGWVELAPGVAAFELDIEQQPIRVRDGSWFVLFGPHPVVGVGLPRIRYDPDGLLVDPAGGSEVLSYRMRVGRQPAVSPDSLSSADERYLQLPRDSRELRAIDSLARDLARGAEDDRERVERVLAYFHRNFEYSLKSSEFPGLRGVIDFLGRRSGHCTYYAAAATLLLRSMKIPTRIATGFLASNWKEDHYVVSTRNGHAWIEVAFEGAGWVTFDPTPADRRAAAFAALERGSERGLGALVGELYFDFERWVSTGREVYMKDFAGAALRLPAAVWTSVRRHPWRVGLALVCLLLAWAWRRRRPSDRRQVRRAPRISGAETDLYGRLLRALERHGYSKPTTQTPREFARSVVASGSPALARVGPWTERFYRARFGGEDFEADERGALRGYIDELRRVDRSDDRSVEPASPPSR